MSEPIIRIENLGKKYQIRHQSGPGYKTLRDNLAGTGREMLRRMRRGLRQPKAADPTREEFWALKDVSFDVQPGEVVGIIGRNGAGKSTLLKILSRITEPTTGRVELGGRVASLLEVGTGFHPELSGRENVYLNGTILGMTRREIDRKFDEIVAFAGVEKFLDTPVKRYSSGMYVRLAFAVAAHLEPEILIIDEVLAVGDAEFQKKCLGKMGDIARGGRTVLFVSHNLPSIRALCNTAILLRTGQVFAHSKVDDVIEKYMSIGYQPSRIEWVHSERPPGNSIIKLRAVYVTDALGSDLNSVELDRAFVINLEYDISGLISGLRLGVLVRSGDGTVVFGASYFPDNTSGSPPSVRYRTLCEVPSHLLNNGSYSITVGGSIFPGSEPLWYLDDCVTFTVEDNVGCGIGNSSLPGVLRPKLRWREESL